jgi:hypothetical protein
VHSNASGIFDSNRKCSFFNVPAKHFDFVLKNAATPKWTWEFIGCLHNPDSGTPSSTIYTPRLLSCCPTCRCKTLHCPALLIVLLPSIVLSAIVDFRQSVRIFQQVSRVRLCFSDSCTGPTRIDLPFTVSFCVLCRNIALNRLRV